MDNHAEQNAASWYASIVDMLKRADMATLTEDTDAIREEITESALSVQVRADWYSPADGMDAGDIQPVEYCILLSTGGPALRITGRVGRHGEPDTAEMQWQDWGTPWTTYGDADSDVLLRFASHFYFGDV
jgi:hypothetical protein